MPGFRAQAAQYAPSVGSLYFSLLSPLSSRASRDRRELEELRLVGERRHSLHGKIKVRLPAEHVHVIGVPPKMRYILGRRLCISQLISWALVT
jgi:hypothetical protein